MQKKTKTFTKFNIDKILNIKQKQRIVVHFLCIINFRVGQLNKIAIIYYLDNCDFVLEFRTQEKPMNNKALPIGFSVGMTPVRVKIRIKRVVLFFSILLLKKLAKFIDNTKNFCNFVLGNHSDIL